jgi:hypothetical protein
MLLVFRHVPSAFRSSCIIYSLHGVNLRPEIEAWQSPKGIASLDLNLIVRSEHSCFFSSPLQTQHSLNYTLPRNAALALISVSNE